MIIQPRDIKNHPAINDDETLPIRRELKSRTIGDIFGHMRFLGQCHKCNVQFMSTHERAYFVSGYRYMYCEKCARKVQAEG